MAIKFFKTKEPYGCFSNFSRHSFYLDGDNWPTSEHYFQAQKYKGTPRYAMIRNASTPRESAEIGRDRSLPIRSDWEQIKDDVMRKAVLRKFLTHSDIKKILLDTGTEDIIEDSPYDAYWGRGPNGEGKNMLGKILMETREYLKEFTHCFTCGTNHSAKAPCPPEAFALLTCSCGNQDLIPGDALCMGLKGMFCGQCDKDTDWKITKPTIEDMKRLWKNYGIPKE